MEETPKIRFGLGREEFGNSGVLTVTDVIMKLSGYSVIELGMGHDRNLGGGTNTLNGLWQLEVLTMEVDLSKILGWSEPGQRVKDGDNRIPRSWSNIELL